MENNQFDNEIKKMLQDMEVPFQGAHWDGMVQRLSEIEEPNSPNEITAFDQSILDKISGFEAPFNEGSWIALRSRLVANAYLKRWILQTKVIEGFFMLFMAVALVYTFDFQPVVPVFDGPIAQINQVHDSKADVSLAEKSHTITAKKSNQKGMTTYINMAVAENGTVGSLSDLDNAMVLAKADDGLMAIAFAKAKSILAKPNNNSFDNKANLLMAWLNPIEQLSPEKLDIRNDLELPRFAVVKTGLPSFGFSMYGILNADYVITGVDTETGIDIPNLWTPGYGGGLAISKDYGKYSATLGVEYQEVKYFPRPVVHIVEGNVDQGYAGTGTSTVELERVNLPISVEYDLVSFRKHRLTAELGLVGTWGKESFQQSTYIMGNESLEDQKALQLGLLSKGEYTSTYLGAVKHSVASTESQEIPKYTQKTKLFASARVSLGYEYKINPQHAIFAKATYSHQLSKKGVGLPDDHINSVGFHFGSRLYL